MICLQFLVIINIKYFKSRAIALVFHDNKYKLFKSRAIASDFDDIMNIFRLIHVILPQILAFLNIKHFKSRDIASVFDDNKYKLSKSCVIASFFDNDKYFKSRVIAIVFDINKYEYVQSRAVASVFDHVILFQL